MFKYFLKKNLKLEYLNKYCYQYLKQIRLGKKIKFIINSENFKILLINSFKLKYYLYKLIKIFYIFNNTIKNIILFKIKFLNKILLLILIKIKLINLKNFKLKIIKPIIFSKYKFNNIIDKING